jgi:hypothetical protein
MAKITRKNMKMFCESASAASRGVAQFGSLAAASPAYSKDPDVIQSLAAWLNGWDAAVTGHNSPAMEDMNAVQYVAAYMLSYLMQQGVAEYEAGTTYYAGSLCTYRNVVYMAIQETIGNAPTSPTYFQRLDTDDNRIYGYEKTPGNFLLPGEGTTDAGLLRTFASVCYDGSGVYVAVGYDAATSIGAIMSSADGKFWTARTSPGSAARWYSVAYGAGLFVAVGEAGAVASSPDGVTWTVRTPSANNDWRCICFGGGLFVAVSSSGTGNRVMTSADGINWEAQTSAADNAWLGVTYGASLFVAVSNDGTGNRCMTSPDGETWTSQSIDDQVWLAITFGNSLFVAVGDNAV